MFGGVEYFEAFVALFGVAYQLKFFVAECHAEFLVRVIFFYFIPGNLFRVIGEIVFIHFFFGKFFGNGSVVLMLNLKSVFFNHFGEARAGYFRYFQFRFFTGVTAQREIFYQLFFYELAILFCVFLKRIEIHRALANFFKDEYQVHRRIFHLCDVHEGIYGFQGVAGFFYVLEIFADGIVVEAVASLSL